MPPAGPPRLTRHLVETRHGAVHVRTTPPVAGTTPLLLLHMSPLSGRMFDRSLPALAPGRQVIVPDRLGFGRSDRLAAPIPFEEYARATVDLLDGLGLDRIDVLGVHTGSCEAIELAVAAPERVRRVAIVALPAFTEEEVASFRATYGPPPEPAVDGSHLAWAWDWWRRWQRLTPGWDLELLHADVVDHLASWPDCWWTYHAVFDYPTAARVAEVGQPLLVLAPHDDLWEQTRRGLAGLPAGAEVVELPHLDLEILNVATAEVCALVDRFLVGP